ncbi:hypothetical protein NADE_009252 [Nannochloris sp. 'desiccata']|nr:hypothetical protein NADE_009252 [Chlorella desiccata (nom. nud.)]
MDRDPPAIAGMRAPPAGSPAGPTSEVLGSGGDGGLHQLPGEPKGLVDKPHRGQFDNARDAAALGDRVDADPLLGLIVDLCSRHTRFVDGDLDLHNGAVFGVLWLFDQGAVKFTNSTLGQRLTEPVLGILHAHGDNHIINGRHQAMKVFHLGVGEVVLQGYVNVIGYLPGLFILVGADSKRTVKAGCLEVDFLLARAVRG